MAKVELKNLKNEKVKDLSISDSIWKIETNDDALKKMIRLQLAATRQGTAKTKTRSEVSGGGKKPWKQKGTGRARQGSIRASGVVPRDYTFKINKKERVLALKSALTDKLNTNSLRIFESLELPSLKTKELKKFIEEASLEGKVLFVSASDNENLYMASRNLGYTYVLYIDDVNVYDIVNADTLVLDEAALNKLEEVLKNA